MEDKKIIDPEQAIALLKDGDVIHTFRQASGIMGSIFLGADIDRQGIIDKMNKHVTTLQLTGPVARDMKHGLALIDEHGALFIETDEEKLNQFDPL